MILTISKIAFILSIVCYWIPFIVAVVKKEEMYVSRHKLEVSNSKTFLTKFTFIVLLILGYISLWPSDVMFHPIKTLIFIFILSVEQYVVFSPDVFDRINEQTSAILQNIMVICLIVLIVLILGTSICFIVMDAKGAKELEPKNYTVSHQIEYITDEGDILYYTESDEPKIISLSDDNVKTEPLKEGETPYVSESGTVTLYTEDQYKKEVEWKQKVEVNQYIVYR